MQSTNGFLVYHKIKKTVHKTLLRITGVTQRAAVSHKNAFKKTVLRTVRMCRNFLFFSTCSKDMSIGSTDRANPTFSLLPHAEVPLPPILPFSPMGEMQGGFANTLVIEKGADNAG